MKVCEYSQEVFAKMIDLGNEKGWESWMSDQDQVKILISEAVKNCHLVEEWKEDEELYLGDIAWLIENR